MLVVTDTNILVRALLGGPGSSATLRLWQAGQIRLVVCRQTLEELAEVLVRPKFRRYFSEDDARRLLTLLRRHGEWVEITSKIALCRDPKDDVFLNLAVSAHARYLVSHDEDLVGDAVLKTKMETEYQVQIVREAELAAAAAKKEQ